MSPLFAMLPWVKSHNDDESHVYEDAAIRRASTHVIDLDGRQGLLAVHEDIHNPGAVSFAVFVFDSGPATQNGIEVDGARWSVVFHGYGYSGPLRECRHTYWGDPAESGYLHSPPSRVIVEALRHLERWFDMGMTTAAESHATVTSTT